jgi:hypothetical protein
MGRALRRLRVVSLLVLSCCAPVAPTATAAPAPSITMDYLNHLGKRPKRSLFPTAASTGCWVAFDQKRA